MKWITKKRLAKIIMISSPQIRHLKIENFEGIFYMYKKLVGLALLQVVFDIVFLKTKFSNN